MFCRLCGLIHVFYKAMSLCLPYRNCGADSDLDEPTSPTLPFPVDAVENTNPGPSAYINEEEARMAVALTEYFQEQRKVYEHVSNCI